MDAVDSYLSKDISMDAYDSYLSKYMDDCACDSYLSKDISMDAYDSDPLLSEKDILYELCCGREPVLKDRELEAGYGACKKYTQIAKAPHVLRLQFDCATRLGFKDEAVQIALLASAQYEITAEMYLALGEYFFKKKELRRARDNLSMANVVARVFKRFRRQNVIVRSLILLSAVKSSLFALENTSTHQQDRASSSHQKESEKEQRTMASSASSLTQEFQQAAPSQFGIVYLPLPVPMRVAEDMEVGKREKSIFLCFSHWIQGRFGCVWYRLDLVNKVCSKIFGRLEWGGISTTCFGVAAVGSIIYILGGGYPYTYLDRSQPDWIFFNDVFYLDVHRPRDGWKEGPLLPSPHFEPVVTSMNETVYIFNGKYVFARALDTSDFGSGWKSLAESPNLESPSDIHFRIAFPDPIRDRILLFSYNGDIFAYYPRKEELERIDHEFKMHPGVICFASAIVDGVLYHNEEDCNELLWAYDLDQRKMLTTVYKVNIAVPYNYFLNRDWEQLLDLGGGKLCLVMDHGGKEAGVLCLKLKVEKEAGGNIVHITVLSFDTFWVLEDISLMRSVAL